MSAEHGSEHPLEARRHVPSAHPGHPPAEEDVVPAWRIAKVGVVALVVFAIGSVAAGLGMVALRRELQPAGPPPTPASAGQAKIGIVEQRLLELSNQGVSLEGARRPPPLLHRLGRPRGRDRPRAGGWGHRAGGEGGAAVTWRALAAALALAPALAAALPLGQALHPSPPIEGSDALPPALESVEIVEKLGAQVPLGLAFTDQEGRRRKLGDLLGQGRPVILSLVYYDCPMLCGLILTGAARGMRETGLALGKDFDAVTLSFDPRDTTPKAAERQRGYLQALGQTDAKAVLDLPHRRRGRRPGGGRGGGLPVHVRREDPAVRPRGGALRADARRARLALPLRRRLPGPRRAAGAGRGRRRAGWARASTGSSSPATGTTRPAASTSPTSSASCASAWAGCWWRCWCCWACSGAASGSGRGGARPGAP